MSKKLTDVLEVLEFIKDRMATKDDVREIVHDEIQKLVPGLIALELRPVRDQLRDIDRRLEALEDHARNMRGFAKEIDDLRAELNAIKKHLGLKTEIAA